MAVSMRNRWFYAVVAAVLVLVAAAVAVFIVRGRTSAAPPPSTPAASAPAPEVILAGTIQAAASVKVPAPVDGRIATFHVEVGAEVSEGELLADIKNEQVEGAEQVATLEFERATQRVSTLEGMIAAARLEASRAGADAARSKSELDRATRNYERQKLLLAEGATPRLAAEKAEKEYKALAAEFKQLSEASTHAESRVSTLQRDLDAAKKLVEGSVTELEVTKTRLAAGQVLSPVAGIVSARRGQPGDNVNPSVEDLFVIATELSQLQVVVEPDPQVMARVKPGLQAGIVLADVPNEVLPGVVKAIEGSRVIIEFANPSPLVKPGMTAQVRIRLG